MNSEKKLGKVATCGNYFIFQLKDTEETNELKFMEKKYLEKIGADITVKNYNLVYGGPMFYDTTLSEIYMRFQISRPEDFTGHTLSVSDVIVLVTDKGINSYYVDGLGFVPVYEFLDAAEDGFFNIEYVFKIGNRYLTLERGTEGYDYTYYDSAYRVLDGGVYDEPGYPFILVLNGLIEELRKPALDFAKGEFVRGRLQGKVTFGSEIQVGNMEEFIEAADAVAEENAIINRAVFDFRTKTEDSFHKISGMGMSEIEQDVRGYIQNVIDVCELDVEIGHILLTGSRSRGIERKDSDIDIVLEYYGDIKESVFFNLLNDGTYSIGGVAVDINPVHKEETGSFAEYLAKADKYLAEKAKETEDGCYEQ